MKGSNEASDRLCEDLRSLLVRRVGSLLQRVSVACRDGRIVVQIVCRSYYAAQLAVSALSTGPQEDRRRPLHLSVCIDGKVLVLHLPPTSPATERDRCGVAGNPASNDAAARSTTRRPQLQNAT